MATDLFNPDNKKYCCGQNAQIQMFAIKWQRIIGLVDNTRVTQLAENTISSVWENVKLLPVLTILPNGSLCLQWQSESKNIKFTVQSDSSDDYDNLWVNGTHDYSPSVEKILNYLQ